MSMTADLKAAIDPLLASRVYRDDRPNSATFPYAVIDPEFALTPALRGDARSTKWRISAQVNLWQTQDDEDDLLLGQVLAALDGATMTQGRYGCTVQQTVRLVDREPDEDTLVHHAITVQAIQPR